MYVLDMKEQKVRVKQFLLKMLLKQSVPLNIEQACD